MFRKLLATLAGIVFLINLNGCVAIVAGAAGATGGVVWIEGKIKQEVNYPMEKVARATEAAFRSLKMTLTKKTVKSDVTQILGDYSDGRNVWVDIHPTGTNTSRVDIRVGMTGDKDASNKILDKILRYL